MNHYICWQDDAVNLITNMPHTATSLSLSGYIPDTTEEILSVLSRISPQVNSLALCGGSFRALGLHNIQQIFAMIPTTIRSMQLYLYENDLEEILQIIHGLPAQVDSLVLHLFDLAHKDVGEVLAKVPSTVTHLMYRICLTREN